MGAWSKRGDGRSRPVAIITGARRGLGRAIAYQMADSGYDLILTDIVDDHETEATVAEAAERGGNVRFVLHDVSDVTTHEAFVGDAASAFGRLDCLVNNAGVQVPRRISILEVGPGEFDPVIAVNMRGTFFLTQSVARWMVGHPSAPGDETRSIITVTSANAAMASIDKAAYCLAKSALSMMTSLFALTLGPHNVGVFEIRPGLMVTDMTRDVRDKYAAYVDETTVFRRWGEPSDVGRAVASIALGAFPYASGQVINVDGGMHIQRL
jgi:NAD(P)-dependent dehydrogenase (short-subunit alcohol dehydrogenase family)